MRVSPVFDVPAAALPALPPAVRRGPAQSWRWPRRCPTPTPPSSRWTTPAPPSGTWPTPPGFSKHSSSAPMCPATARRMHATATCSIRTTRPSAPATRGRAGHADAAHAGRGARLPRPCGRGHAAPAGGRRSGGGRAARHAGPAPRTAAPGTAADRRAAPVRAEPAVPALCRPPAYLGRPRRAPRARLGRLRRRPSADRPDRRRHRVHVRLRRAAPHRLAGAVRAGHAPHHQPRMAGLHGRRRLPPAHAVAVRRLGLGAARRHRCPALLARGRSGQRERLAPDVVARPGAGRPRCAGRASELLRGRRLRPLGRRPPADRGGVGACRRGPAGAGQLRRTRRAVPAARRRHRPGRQPAADVRRCVGMDRQPVRPLSGLPAGGGGGGRDNGKFMCSQMVLRGGSCVSPEGHLRATYRNFFYPHQRWQFTGVRLARAA